MIVAMVVSTMILSIAWPRALAVCPTRCQCDEEQLIAACVNATLEYVPITLNPELRHLTLARNKISNLHYTISIYARLVHLDLAHNRLQTLGAGNFDALAELTYLSLRANGMRALARDAFKGLVNLRVLDLSENALGATPSALTGVHDLTRLERLSLNDNNLTRVGAFERVPKLHTLHLQMNQILEMPAELLRRTRVQHLNLSGNLIDEIGESLAARTLAVLDLSANVIGAIADVAFYDMTALTRLDLSDNNLTHVPTRPLAKLVNLSELNLSGNFVAHVDALAFQSLFNLERLQLDRMSRLRAIDPRAFVDNVNLQAISLNGNGHLRALNHSLFVNCPRLTRVSLRDCAFVSLRATDLPLHQLLHVHVTGVRFHCNCSLFWLKQLSRDVNVTVDVRCSTPKRFEARNLSDVSEVDLACVADASRVFYAIGACVCVIISVASLVFYIIWLKCLPSRDTRATTQRPSHNLMTSIATSNISCSNSYVNNVKRAATSTHELPNDLLANDPWYKPGQFGSKAHVVFV